MLCLTTAPLWLKHVLGYLEAQQEDSGLRNEVYKCCYNKESKEITDSHTVGLRARMNLLKSNKLLKLECLSEHLPQ
jgi:hypothetical protein